jgi:hypothetical protein
MRVVPSHLFNPDPVSADVVSRVISGGTALSGEEDVIATDGGGRWEISYGEMDIDHNGEDPYLQRVWDAWTSHFAGGAQSFLMPLLSLATAPRPIGGNQLATPSDIYADDDYLPTEVRFSSPHIIAAMGDDVALRATTMEIVITQGAAVQPGMKFSVGTRAYKIERVLSRDGLTAVCKTAPPAREAIEQGAEVNFDWPVVECRAVIGQGLAASMMQGMFGTVALAAVEHVTYGD